MSSDLKFPNSADFAKKENELRLARHEIRELHVGLEHAIQCNAQRRAAHANTLELFRGVLLDFIMFCENRTDPDVVRDVGNPIWLKKALSKVESELRCLSEKP